MNLLEELHKSFSNEEKKDDSVKLSENDIDAISEKVFSKLTESKKEVKEESKEEQKEIEKI